MPSRTRSAASLPALSFLILTAALAGPVPAQEAPRAATEQADWPEAARTAAASMREKYGPPQEETASLLIWRRNGPWMRTVVHRNGAAHDFPAKHVDALEQTIPYKVPPNLLGPLATFNGSLVADRTRGTLTAYAASEAETILMLNLARKLVRGEIDAGAARNAQVEAAKAMAAGTTPDEAAKLTIESQQEGDVTDPDTAMILPPGRTR